MKIIMCASEAAPLAKTGGLADVVYALSAELVKKGHEVSIIMPFYSLIRDKAIGEIKPVNRFIVDLAWRRQECEVYETAIDGITYYLLGNANYFDRHNLYSYDDDNERFAFFTLAIRKVIQELKLNPDIIHVHDWQVGMLPVLLKEQNAKDPTFANTRCVLTIHNPAFKGMFDPYFLGDYYGLTDDVYHNGKVRYNNQCSSLKAAIMYCDKITTVSPTHAEELLSADSGHDLHTVLELRRFDFCGVLNGIDYQEFNPSKDKKIAKTYSVKTFKEGKKANKDALLEQMHLNPTDRPLFGMVSRLTWQKGADLVIEGVRFLLNRGCSVAILGSGEYGFEQELERLRAEYPNQMGIYIGYNDALAHQIYAASDIFLMPSLFEPCGIGQMIAERYGTLPLVRMTGGLNDTVVPHIVGNEKVATGFGFYAYDKQAMVDTVNWAINSYDNPEVFAKIIVNAMKVNNDWSKSADNYINIYQGAHEK